MKIGTLFSGIGAPEQGAKRVYGDNLELVFACEYDKFARQSFNANYYIHPDHFHNDVREMEGTKYQGKVDVLVGGSPCQAFSIAGLRNGTDDERGQLIYQYIRIVDEVKAPVIVYENVKGMLSIDGGKTIREFVQALRDIGYFCHYEVVNTKDYGVPQNRERVFLVGFLDHEMYHRFQFSPKQKLEKRLRDVLESEVDEKYYLSEKAIEGFNNTNFRQAQDKLQIGDIATTVLARDYKDPKIINEGVIDMLDIKGNDQIKRVYGTDGSAPCLQTMQGGNREPKILAMRGRYEESGDIKQQLESRKDGLSNTITCVQKDNLLSEPKIEIVGSTMGGNEMNSRIYGLQGLAPTLNAGNNGGGQSPVKHLTNDHRIRKLTPRECLRLQDFPDSFIQVVSDSQQYKQAGNSMSVNVLEMIFRQIEKAKEIEQGRLF